MGARYANVKDRGHQLCKHLLPVRREEATGAIIYEVRLQR
jgi:hypothetical protein